MDSWQLVVWAVIPPLLLLVYYYRRVLAAPPLLKLLLGFGFGALFGLVALGLEWGFEQLANKLVDWDNITQSLAGVALRQLLEVGPIEEGCKLGGVMLMQAGNREAIAPKLYGLSRPILPSTLFFFTIVIALGFTAEENYVYLVNDTASILNRLIGTPVHALFSAPWGYTLAVASCSTIRSGRNKGFIASSWVNAVICHALVNVLSNAWRYSPPLSFLSYGLFPFLLWMYWRLEALLRRVQTKPPIILISGFTPIHRYWQRGLALFALILGGNAIFGFFLLATSLSPLSPSQLFYPEILWFFFSRFVLNLIPGIIAWRIYKYLRHSSHKA